MSRIQWTEEEKIKVAQEYFNLRDKHMLPSRSEDGWRMAQEKVLPPTRWRPFTASPAASSMNAVLNELVRDGKVKRQEVKAIHPPPPIKQTVMIDGLPVSKETYDLVVKHHKAVSPPPISLDDFLRNMMSETINKALPTILEKVGEMLVAERSHQQTQFNRFMKAIDPNFEVEEKLPPIIPGSAIAQPVGHKPVIVLVNAMADQTQSIQSAFPQYEIRSVQDRMPGEQNPLLVVGFTKFMNKSTDNLCASKFGASYMRVGHKGAMSEAKRKIATYTAHVQ